jgi:hypothetical protein
MKALHPTFGDIDGDGKLEMISGTESGKLLLFKDQSASGSDPEFVLEDENFQGISVSGFSTPQLIDLNGNGLPDLVIGQSNGKLSYYENQGSPSNPDFVKITDNLGNVNVTDPMVSYTGHSTPWFFRDAAGQLRLFVGSESGKIFYFRDLEDNLSGEFMLAEERLLLIREGIRTAPAVGFITGSDFPDLIIGNYSGGLSFYQGAIPKPFGVNNLQNKVKHDFEVYPNPASGSLTLSVNHTGIATAGLEVYDLTGRLLFTKNNLGSRQTIPVGEWNRGLYLFNVKFTAYDGREWLSRKKVVIN